MYIYIILILIGITYITYITYILLLSKQHKVACITNEWGPCNHLTGKRKRRLLKEGTDCILEETCPVNCETSVWSACINGKQTKTITRKPLNGGRECGILEQTC